MMEQVTSDMNHIGTVCLFVVAESVVRSDNCLEGVDGSENIRRLPRRWPQKFLVSLKPLHFSKPVP